MEPLFKFLLERPPIQQSIDTVIDLTQNSDYQAALAASVGADNPRVLLKTASTEFVNSNSFITDLTTLRIHERLLVFQSELDKLVLETEISENEMKETIKNSFQVRGEILIEEEDFLIAIKNIKDTIIAIKHLPEEYNQPIEKLVNALRDLEIVQRVMADDNFPGGGRTLKKFRTNALRLPTQSDLKSIITKREEERKRQQEIVLKKAESKRLRITEKSELYYKLKTAISEIMNLDSQHLESSTQTRHDGYLPPKEIRPITLFKEQVERLNSLGRLQILNARTQVEKGENFDFFSKERLETVSILKTQEFNRRSIFSGVNSFNPSMNLDSPFRYKRGTENLLSEETRALLDERKMDVASIAIDKVVSRLRFEMNELSNELDILTESEKFKSFKRIGNTMIISTTPKTSMWSQKHKRGFAEKENFTFTESIPSTKGNVIPSGIADLIIVKQQLKGYKGTDVAHIENILKGELKVRDHRKYSQTVTDTLSEVERTSIEERELESTDRFELSRESSNTIKSDASLKAGLTVSASYGPTVKISASLEGATNTSKEEVTKAASQFSKEVTSKSVEKLSERILERKRIVVTSEVEERNNHTLDNVGGEAHISGIYQWVEKEYEAQMYNYGKRMMFDFMIPEPGAYLVEAMQKNHSSIFEITKPFEFDLEPHHIGSDNYYKYVHQYGAAGVKPPPKEYITKSFGYSAGEGEKRDENLKLIGDYFTAGKIEIDEGYAAVEASVGIVANIAGNGSISIDIIVGRKAHRFINDGKWVWKTWLDHETESIPFALKTNDASDIAVAIEVKCIRTDRAIKEWQLNTHSTIMDSYKAKLAEYEEKLAELEIRTGIEIEGKNPALNLETIKDELKKNCISILTDQHFDLFNAIQSGSNDLPQINLWQNESEGKYVRFFEQAFEWENITWLTYPYFWGRKSKWEEKIGFEDPDPLFNQFIKAGYCRVAVPARPGFEGAIDHFLTFGEVWNGGPLPPISNELYLPIAEELAERLDRPGSEIPEGDPWNVTVPTNLVILRKDDKLPNWVKDENGNWVESTNQV